MFQLTIFVALILSFINQANLSLVPLDKKLLTLIIASDDFPSPTIHEVFQKMARSEYTREDN